MTTGPDAETDFEALKREDKRWWYFYDQDIFKPILNKNKLATIYDYWIFHFASPKSIYSEAPCKKKYKDKEIKNIIEKYSNNRG